MEADLCFSLRTIVDNYTRDAECLLDFCKSDADRGGIREVARNVQLIGSACSFSRGDCYAVTFRCKGASYALADIWARTEDEDDG